ncbi:hypothetical protein SteCoe_10832 [Stentor coeruleus]|uniref:Uncharacterized protein n=1 Tax=Stentor coeruleus TaxID=5963 RepID=A0A1R2CEN1_9CILI|nr:hypothetical protein SteCoe_10832 [Stentor coeruleus]
MAIVQDSARNTFLKEIDRNSNIGSDVRREIEYRFNNSQVNKTYKFPRTNESSTPIIKHKSKLSLQVFEKTKKKVRTLSNVYTKKQLTLTKFPLLQNGTLKPSGKTLNQLRKVKTDKSFSSSTNSFSSSLSMIPKNAIFKKKNHLMLSRLS